MIGTLIIFVAILSLLVFVHELGHFVSAKKSGVSVEEFGFGFPPRMVGVKRGGTIYSINWIPLGGFVKIKGESGERRGDKDSFGHKPTWQRAIILAAGVIMNVLLAWFLLTVGYVIGLPQVVEDLSKYARVSDAKIQVISVLKDSPADKAGFQSGDTVLSLDGAPIAEVEQVRGTTELKKGTEVAFVVKRDGEVMTKNVVPDMIAQTGRAGVGVALVKTGIVSYPIWLAPIEGLNATWVFSKDILSAFYGLFRDLFVHKEVTVEFSGPVGIAVMTAEVAKLGFRYLLQFTALLSLNLAMINILPFPALDGGRIVFLIAEALRGRAVSRRLEIVTHNIGFILLMMLVIVVTYRDVVRFGDRIWSAVTSLFGLTT
jgi:regulator of sigma E protease